MEEVIKIEGGHRLHGSVRISGSKNATVALIPAAVLALIILAMNQLGAWTGYDLWCAQHLGRSFFIRIIERIRRGCQKTV